MRLLFSSAQVEYMRYWLHTVKLTAEPIPLPTSEYLIQAGDLLTCSPDVYKDPAALKKAIKVRSRVRRQRGRRGGQKHRKRKSCTDLVRGGCAQGIDKNNKRLRGTGSLLTARRFAFERVRTLWAAKIGTWLALDFEAWDMDHTALTEFGWSAVRWVDGEPVKEDGHLVVKEHRMYTQHYVANNREVRPEKPPSSRWGQEEWNAEPQSSSTTSARARS